MHGGGGRTGTWRLKYYEKQESFSPKVFETNKQKENSVAIHGHNWQLTIWDRFSIGFTTYITHLHGCRFFFQEKRVK